MIPIRCGRCNREAPAAETLLVETPSGDYALVCAGCREGSERLLMRGGQGVRVEHPAWARQLRARNQRRRQIAEARRQRLALARQKQREQRGLA